mgnify:CR=1 FL=1
MRRLRKRVLSKPRSDREGEARRAHLQSRMRLPDAQARRHFPYVLTAVYDRRAAGKKAWETRRANPKPYPDAARLKAAANLAQNVEKLGRVSKFELEAADVFRRLGFLVNQSVAVRNPDGTFLTVFDIVIPNRRMVVECHGTYWHGGRWSWDTPNATQVKNLRYEQRKLAVARSVGYDLRLLWEHEFRQDPTGACLAVVR